MKINATSRLQAMTIKNGDNFPDVKKNIKMLMDLPCTAFKMAGEVAGHVVLERTAGLSCWYVVVDQKPDLSAATLKKSGVKSIEAMMTVMKFPNVDEVFSVWVSDAKRGQGVGKALYKFAHSKAKKGLESSEDLGTMSLALWLSLYKSEPKVNILIDRKKVSRDQLEVDGLAIKWTHKGQTVDITSQPKPLFKFFWK